VATTNKIPTLGFAASIAGVVLLGFGSAPFTVGSDPIVIYMRADDITVQWRADDLRVRLRADETEAAIVADETVVVMRADDLTVQVVS